jgi:hypothetical protein
VSTSSKYELFVLSYYEVSRSFYVSSNCTFGSRRPRWLVVEFYISSLVVFVASPNGHDNGILCLSCNIGRFLQLREGFFGVTPKRRGPLLRCRTIGTARPAA